MNIEEERNDTNSLKIGAALTLVGLCTVPIALAQLIVGGLYIDQCPAERMLPTFDVVSGVIGLLGASLFSTAGILHLRKQDGRTGTIVTMIGGFIVYGFFIPWYMYGGTLTSVDKSAKLRQSINPNDSSTYCIAQVQQSIDGIVLMYWISFIIFLLGALFLYLKSR